MECPKCHNEMRIDSSGYVMKDGKLYLRQRFKCRSPQCDNYNKIVSENDTEVPFSNE